MAKMVLDQRDTLSGLPMHAKNTYISDSSGYHANFLCILDFLIASAPV